MNAKRILGVIVGATLVVAVFLIVLGFNVAPQAEGSGKAYTGFGDFRRYEVQLDKAAQLAASSKAVEVGENLRRADARANSSNFMGFGQLRKYENQLALAQKGTGFGDLRKAEQQQALLKAAAPISNNAYAGMGDLRRLEAQQTKTPGMGDLRLYEAQH